jgi:hypothetical protein
MGTVWELDFYSRPILDENQKKRWEILICEGAQSVADDPSQGFRFSKFVSNTQVNSIELKKALEEAMEKAPTPPNRVRFFRYQMQNMINRACDELGLPVRVSRRPLVLQQWLEERQAQVYPQEPGYQGGANPSVSQPLEIAKPLPDALIGQQWALVNLPARDLADMPEWDISFGEGFPLSLAGVSPEGKVPGILIFSSRALPLAAWMSGVELAGIKAQIGDVSRLLLETGSNDTWILATLNNPAMVKEAQQFESAKAEAKQVHFVAVQDNPDAESFAGFWLLQERRFG